MPAKLRATITSSAMNITTPRSLLAGDGRALA
jgi:hypothetical protein